MNLLATTCRLLLDTIFLIFTFDALQVSIGLLDVLFIEWTFQVMFEAFVEIQNNDVVDALGQEALLLVVMLDHIRGLFIFIIVLVVDANVLRYLA